LKWWNRPIDEKAIWASRGFGTLAIVVLFEIVTTPWLLFTTLTVATCGVLFALLIRYLNRRSTGVIELRIR